MRVLIATAGARGDVAPLTGLATAIRAAGHSVTIASNDEYERLVVGCGLEFRALPGTHGMFDDLRWVERSALAAGVGIARLLAENVRTLHKAVLAVARQVGADVLALTGITAVGGYQVAEGLALPSIELQLMPTHATADFPLSIVTGRSFGRLGNRVAGMATTAARAAHSVASCPSVGGLEWVWVGVGGAVVQVRDLCCCLPRPFTRCARSIRLKQGLEAGQDAGHPSEMAGVPRCRARSRRGHRELDGTVADVLDVEGDLGAGFGAPGRGGCLVHADRRGPLGGDGVPGVGQPVGRWDSRITWPGPLTTNPTSSWAIS